MNRIYRINVNTSLQPNYVWCKYIDENAYKKLQKNIYQAENVFIADRIQKLTLNFFNFLMFHNIEVDILSQSQLCCSNAQIGLSSNIILLIFNFSALDYFQAVFSTTSCFRNHGSFDFMGCIDIAWHNPSHSTYRRLFREQHCVSIFLFCAN